MIIVVDFGSQTTHLIARRLKELGSQTTIVTPGKALKFIQKFHSAKASRDKVQGIVLSGGPSSVYEKHAPTIDPAIFDQDVPLLGICYGLQLAAHLLGGKVIPGKKEYGPAQIKLKVQSAKFKVTKEIPNEFTVWMSHGDEVVELPKGFETLGSTEHVPFAFAQDSKRKMYGLQFHPEVEHTEWGSEILRNFVAICHFDEGEIPSVSNKEKGISPLRQAQDRDDKRNDSGQARMTIDIKALEEGIREKVGEESYVIGAISGGVDSTVAGVLTAKAIGKRFIPIFVDNGLMREKTEESVKRIFTEYGIEPIVIKCEEEMLKRLAGIKDSERKRKIIGNYYIELFEQQMYQTISHRKKVEWLLQGTIYSDVIESKGTKHAAKIKSHHNVGGLPKDMKLKLLEPLREFYKDEVRFIGRQLGLPNEFVDKQPFPGPGYAVRIRGEVTKERLAKERQADTIVLEELEKGNLLQDVFISFPVMTGASSTAVKGDGRFFGEIIALRVVQSKDVMTATWARLPYQVLQNISSRIVNEVPGVSRVVYDISTKPPATMEWE